MVEEKTTTEDKATEVDLKQAEDNLRAELDARFSEVIKELEKPENTDRGYRVGTELTISGELFTTFVNLNARNQKVLDAVQRNLVAAYEAIDSLTTEVAKMTVELTEAHLRFVKEGKTEPNSELLKY